MKITIEGNAEEIKKLFGDVVLNKNKTTNSIDRKNRFIPNDSSSKSIKANF